MAIKLSYKINVAHRMIILIATFISVFIIHIPPSQALHKVSKIKITGLYSMSEAEFLNIFGISPGDDITFDLVRDGIKRAFLKGIFNDIRVLRDDRILIIEAVERNFIEEILIKGNNLLKKKRIKKIFSLKEGVRYNEATLVRAINTLNKELYLRGFQGTEITYEVRPWKKPGRVSITLNVNEAEPLRINKIIFPDKEADHLDYLFDVKEGDVFDYFFLHEKIVQLEEKLKTGGYYQHNIGPYCYDRETGNLIILVNTGKKLYVSFIERSVFSKKRLLKELPFLENKELNDVTIEESVKNIESLYKRSGYIGVRVANSISEREGFKDIHFYLHAGERYKIDTIVFYGININEKELKDILGLKEGKFFNPYLIEADIEAILDFYRSAGYVNAHVDKFEEIIDESDKTVDVIVKITEGTQIRLSDVEIKGNISIKDNEIHSALALEPGTPYNESAILEAKQRIKLLYTEIGYADADINAGKEISESSVKLLFEIREGVKYTFGHTIIKGNSNIKYKVFERLFIHRRGDPFNFNILLEESGRFYRTGLVSNVKFDIHDNPDNSKDVVIDLEEAKPGTIEFGFGYAGYEGLRGFFDISYRNVMNMNREITFRTEVSRLLQDYSIRYYEPWFMGIKIPFKSIVSFENRIEENIDTREVRYRVRKYSALSGIEKLLSNTVKSEFSYKFSFIETFDVKDDVVLSKEDTGTLAISGIIPSLIFDTRDNPLDPTKGYLGGLSLEAASFLLFSETDYIKLSGHINLYKKLTDRFTLAFSIRGGIAEGMKDTIELPITERFFLGGRTTVRGFSHDNLGPKGDDGTPTGGNAFFMENIEVRTKLNNKFGLVAFVDTGNVWTRIDDFDLTDMRYTAGLGLRYMTGVGPLRVDYGYKLDRESDESAGEIHFSIGHAF